MAEFKVEDEFSLSKEDQLSRMASFASGSGFSSSNSIPRPRSYESNDGDDVLDGGGDKDALKAGSLEDKMVSAFARSILRSREHLSVFFPLEVLSRTCISFVEFGGDAVINWSCLSFVSVFFLPSLACVRSSGWPNPTPSKRSPS